MKQKLAVNEKISQENYNKLSEELNSTKDNATSLQLELNKMTAENSETVKNK